LQISTISPKSELFFSVTHTVPSVGFVLLYSKPNSTVCPQSVSNSQFVESWISVTMSKSVF
jgi:hypothetical protein